MTYSITKVINESDDDKAIVDTGTTNHFSKGGALIHYIKSHQSNWNINNKWHAREEHAHVLPQNTRPSKRTQKGTYCPRLKSPIILVYKKVGQRRM